MKSSPIYGVSIINARRSAHRLYSQALDGLRCRRIENPLLFKPNTRMLFGDAKASLQALVAEFKAS